MQEKTLVVVAHMDDETLSCAGLIMRRENVHVVAVYGRYYSGEDESATDKAERQDFLAACKVLGVKTPHALGLTEGEPHRVGYYEVLERVEQIMDSQAFTEVVIPSEHDMNQDHRMLADVMRIALRPGNLKSVKRVLKSIAHDSMMTTPQFFVPMDKWDMARKQEALRCYRREQRTGPHPRSPENIEALARLHGSRCGCEFAEGYHVHMMMESP